MKKTRYAPVNLAHPVCGIQFKYTADARSVEQARRDPAAPIKQAPSKQTPRARCPRCKGQWEILQGSPLLTWRRYTLRPETECPTYACRASHLSLAWTIIVDMYPSPRNPQQELWTSRELAKYDRGVREGELVQQHLAKLQ